VENLIDQIIELKNKKNYVILAHNYLIPEIQDIADFKGDSLELAKMGLKLDAESILFAGVDFMAETIKILNPDKNIIVPVKSATCPMANSLTKGMLEKFIKEYKKQYPDLKVVLYVNSTAETKMLADYVCTSGNAVEIVSKIESKSGKLCFTTC